MILQVHRLDGARCALVLVIEVLEGLEVVLGPEQLLALDAEDLGDAQGLVRNLGEEAQQIVQFVGRQEIPVDDLCRGCPSVPDGRRPSGLRSPGSGAGPHGRSAASAGRGSSAMS